MANQPLKVLIIGAGIGGLTTAIGLRQQGHDVEIFEKSELIREYGAAMHLSPNCTALLNRFGIYPATIGGTRMCKGLHMNSSEETILSLDFETIRDQWQADYYLIHRIDLHNELKRKATAADGNSCPAKLHRGSAVCHVDPEAATLTLTDGRKFSGDVIIAADGIHSKTRDVVTGDKTELVSTGKSCYRCITPISDIRQDPVTAEFVESPGTVIEILGEDRSIIFYPCSDNKSLYTGAFVPTTEVGVTREGWGRTANKEKMISSFSCFPRKVRAVLEKAPEHDVKVWDLLDCPAAERWTRGRTMLLGDAAHPFLPYMGQGGAMAIEDAASISALLRMGTSPAEVPGLLALFQECRKERVDRILEFTRRRGRDYSGKQGPYPQAREFTEFAQYCLSHNEWDHTYARLKKRSANQRV